jgi:hypothetical protein
MKKLLLLFVFVFMAFSSNALIYSVTVPKGTKACYSAGEMNGWSHQQMKKVDDTHYTIDIATANTTQPYKYCSGPGWGYVEKASDGSEVDNRSYAANDIVATWVAIYDKMVKNMNVVYSVTVPQDTKCCYIAGGWDGWTNFTEMKKVDPTHYTITILSNKIFKYNYFAGNGPGYSEMDAKKMANERSYSTKDVVTNWAAVYDKTIPDADITYFVTVPEGTSSCYIAGGWNRWSFLEMKKVDPTHFEVTVKSNKALKYVYLSGPDWNCVEAGLEKSDAVARSYNINDVVLTWKSIWEPKK